MKVAITGHTSGLGKALKERFESSGHTVIGFCITTGYDISDTEARSRIIAESADCDVFINNAYYPNSQHLMFESAYNAFDNTEKTIINIGSKVIDINLSQHEHDEWLSTYHCDKTALQELVKDKYLKPNPRILNVLSGLINTNMSSGRKDPKIDVVDVADLIYQMFILRDRLIVQEISILPVVQNSIKNDNID